jgi:RNA polymerase-binding transcription factor DksA
VSDPIDQAQDLALAEIEQIQARRLASIPVPVKRGIAVYCTRCGELIDPRRVQAVAGCTRCVGCQEHSERRIGSN